VASGLLDYEDLAVALAVGSKKREEWRGALKAGIERSGVFQTGQWVEGLEASYMCMLEVHAAGLGPMHCVASLAVHGLVHGL